MVLWMALLGTWFGSTVIILTTVILYQAQLQPSDDITIAFDVTQGAQDAVKALNDVIRTHKEYIEDSVKQPLVPSAHSPTLSEIIHEKTEVSINPDLPGLPSVTFVSIVTAFFLL